ncbi:diacylglycerol kinase family protein, partial [Marinobacter sp.]
IRCDGDTAQGKWLSIAVASGAFYGGGNPIPQAAANDGQLDVVAVRPRSFVRLLLAYVMVRIFGREARKNATIVHFKGRHCSVTTRRPKTITADGEVVSSTPLEARCESGRLQVLCEVVVNT